MNYGGTMKSFLTLVILASISTTATAQNLLPTNFLTSTEEIMSISCTDATQEIYVGYKMIRIKNRFEGREVVSIKHNQWNPTVGEMLGNVETINLLKDVQVSAPKANILKMRVGSCNGDENQKMGNYLVYYDATIVRNDGKALVDIWNRGVEPDSHRKVEVGLLCSIDIFGCQVPDNQ
jgi:hypothetical protein